MSSAALAELAERNNRMEKRERVKAMTERFNGEKTTGFTTALVASTLAGYIDGKFDLKDGVDGNGVTVFGVPAMPLAAGVLVGGGLYWGGKIGNALAYSGLGVACGFAYGRSENAGKNSAG